MRRFAATTTSLVALLAGVVSAPAQELTHDLLVGPEILFFDAGAADDLSVAARASGHLQWSPPPDDAAAFILEPRAGLRVLSFDERSSTEFVAELRESLFSIARGRRVRWYLNAQQKLRVLSDQPELPAFLEPGRFEALLGGGMSVPVVARWELEARADAGLVRYRPAAWEVLDRNVAAALIGLSHPLWMGTIRILGGTGIEEYRDVSAQGREDTRWDLRGEWVSSEPIFVQLEGGMVWNSSNRPGFEYRTWRAGLLLSLPLGSGSLQLYSALASKTYTNPGPDGALVAPSDRDTGSFVILQTVQPLGSRTNLHLRTELSSSETGFRDQYFKRVGFSVLVSFN